MSITIVATPGDASANSFITEAEYIAYLATRLNVPAGSTLTGTTASETEKAAMLEATRDLTLLSYVGERPTAAQPLAWPRLYAPNPDAPTFLLDPDILIPIGTAAVYYATDEIPKRLKDATCELALQYTKAGATDLATADDALGLSKLAIGTLELDFVAPTERAQGLARFPRVLALLQPLFTAATQGGLSVVRC